MRRVWKIVIRTSDETLVSSAAMGIHELRYTPGIQVVAKDIFVLSELPSHESFRRDYQYTAQLWIAEAKGIHKAPKRVASAVYLDEEFDEFWDNPEKYALRNATFEVPANTVLCNALTLRERIY